MIRAESNGRGDGQALGRLALSADEVAALLGISRAHVWKLASTGRLPKPVRLGRAVRWDRKNLEAWLAAGAPTRDRWECERGTTAPNR